MFYNNFYEVIVYFKHNITTNVALIAVFAIFIAFIVRKYMRFRSFANKVHKLPGAPCSMLVGTIIGNFEWIWSQPINNKSLNEICNMAFRTFIGALMTFRDAGHGLYRIWVGPKDVLIILYRADTVEPLLSSNTLIDKSWEYRFFRPWLGLGLLTSTGNRWRSHRKLLTPSFHFRILENFVPVINGQQNVMINIIDSKLNQNNGLIADIRPIITNCALDTICETAMGVTVKAQTDLDSQYVNSVQDLLILWLMRYISPWLWSDFIYGLSSSGKQFMKNTAVLHEFTNSVIKERKTEFMRKMNEKGNNSLDEVMEEMGSKRKLAFLDSLLVHHIRNPREFTESDIREEVDTFMFEGHDTTAAAIQFSLILIGLDESVQVKIHEEMDAIFGDDMCRDITTDDLRQMRYLEQCIKEALRLYPSVPYIARENQQDFNIGEHVIPKGSTCVPMIYMLHRDPKVFPNPEVYDPNRFASDGPDVQSRHPYAYVPFSAGPRNCIGQKFALLEEKALLAAILRRYRIRCLIHRDQLVLDIAAILKPHSKIPMSFIKRF